jgi:hypothetical protein
MSEWAAAGVFQGIWQTLLELLMHHDQVHFKKVFFIFPKLFFSDITNTRMNLKYFFSFIFAFVVSKPTLALNLQSLWEEEIEESHKPFCTHYKFDVCYQQLVFVPGILHEMSFFILKKAIKSISDTLQLPITIIHSQSTELPLENAKRIAMKIQKEYTKNKKPIVLVGHSKGGLELLYLTLTYPQLIEYKMIDKIIILQAPVQGAQIIQENKTLSTFQAYFKIPTVDALNPTTVKCTVTNLYQDLHPSNNSELISKSIFYVTSAYPRNKSLWQWALHWLGGRLHLEKPNDGLLYEEEQSWETIGTHLGTVQAHHWFLYNILNKKDIKAIQGLFRAILKFLYIS